MRELATQCGYVLQPKMQPRCPRCCNPLEDEDSPEGSTHGCHIDESNPLRRCAPKRTPLFELSQSPQAPDSDQAVLTIADRSPARKSSLDAYGHGPRQDEWSLAAPGAIASNFTDVLVSNLKVVLRRHQSAVAEELSSRMVRQGILTGIDKVGGAAGAKILK